MASSRRRTRTRDRKLAIRTIRYFIFTFGLILFLILVGPKILVNFSLLVGTSKEDSPEIIKKSSFLFPPFLDPQPSATNSGTISISGSGQPGTTAVLIQNGQEVKKILVGKDGFFSFANLKLQPEENIFAAKATDNGKESEISNRLSVLYKSDPPKLEISSPEPDSLFREDNDKVTVNGQTEKGANLKINGRIVPVKIDGSFSFPIKLKEGENTITVKARDIAGNETEKELTVTYEL